MISPASTNEADAQARTASARRCDSLISSSRVFRPTRATVLRFASPPPARGAEVLPQDGDDYLISTAAPCRLAARVRVLREWRRPLEGTRRGLRRPAERWQLLLGRGLVS